MSTILLDIDGALRPNMFHDEALGEITPPSLVTHWNGEWSRFEILRREVPEFFENFPTLTTEKYNTIVSKELMRELLALETAGHDLQWFTMWEHFTALLSRELSGFGANFPIHLFDGNDDFEWSKMGTLKRLLDNNPDMFFVLVDDTALDEPQSEQMIEEWVSRGQLGVVVPMPHYGITRSEMEAIKLMASKERAGILS